uniref:glycosyltransferase family 4 protein n=1 Tax=Algoriphagus sp. TaxID=1872435 RepID=UPI004047586F
MKRIVYLTFYFEPDLCAGSFRNTPLAIELAKQAHGKKIIVDVYTTLPNRYSTFEQSAPEFEELGNLRIHRIPLPPHKSGMLDQVFSFKKFYSEVIKLNKNKRADLVFASSSRLFTAFLGYTIAKKNQAPLYLDIRDIFVDTISDVFKSKILKLGILPLLRMIEERTFNYAKHINLISGGFRSYFSKFRNTEFTFFTNGIDEEFLELIPVVVQKDEVGSKKKIVYAGNIGEGQGLHKVIPQAAKELGTEFEFLIIGDGGTKKLLQDEIENLSISNVVIQNPVNRKVLQTIYNDADYLFIHLNDYPAFRKVLPSKIFELATFGKPIIAGVSGFAAEFIKSEVSNSFVFNPCNVKQLVNFLRSNITSNTIERNEFKLKYRRSNINKLMAESILSYI